MTTARILLKQGASTYRFLRFETSTDGSLIVIIDRDASTKRGAMRMGDDGIFVPDEIDSGEILPSGRFSIHTTGEIHRYAGGKRQGTIHIEPLHALTKLALVGFLSIPRTSRLDFFDEDKHRQDAVAILDIPEDIFERITFCFEIGPKPQEPQTYGVGLNYELYSIVVRAIPNFLELPPELVDHFIHGMPNVGLFEKRQTDQVSAELAFYQRIHGPTAFVFREDKGGAYVAMALVPMVRVQNLTIGFDRPDLRIEIIPFETQQEPTP
jgi:hypothetical protein